MFGKRLKSYVQRVTGAKGVKDTGSEKSTKGPKKGPENTQYADLNTAGKKTFWAENPLVGDITIKLPFRSDELKMRCENDDTVVKELHWTDFVGWEPVSLRLWQELSSQLAGRCVLDVGSYSGIYSLIAAQNSPNSRTLAFDIQQRCLDRVQINAALNNLDNVETILAACGDEDGFCTFYFYEEPDILSSVASIVPKAMNDKSAQVRVLRLDTILDDLGCRDRVGLMKIDVEDAETTTLSGMKHTLTQSRPDMLVEINSQENVERVRALIPDYYQIYAINEETGDLSHVVADALADNRHRNYFITCKEPSEVQRLATTLEGSAVS